MKSQSRLPSLHSATMALRSGTPGLELALTLLAVLAFQRFFAAYGAGIWIALYDSAGPQWAAMALVYVAAFNLVWQFCRFGSVVQLPVSA